MSTYSTSARNAARDAVSALLPVGSGSYPTMVIRDGSQTALVSIELDATTPIGAAIGGVATMNPPNGEGTWVDFEVTPIAAGTAADFVLRDKDDAIVETGSVGTIGSGEELELTTLTISTAIPLKFSAAPTLTQRASYDPTP